jgi:hypothetical protein
MRITSAAFGLQHLFPPAGRAAHSEQGWAHLAAARPGDAKPRWVATRGTPSPSPRSRFNLGKKKSKHCFDLRSQRTCCLSWRRWPWSRSAGRRCMKFFNAGDCDAFGRRSLFRSISDELSSSSPSGVVFR